MKFASKAKKPLSVFFALVLASSLWPAPPVAAVPQASDDPALAPAEAVGEPTQNDSAVAAPAQGDAGADAQGAAGDAAPSDDVAAEAATGSEDGEATPTPLEGQTPATDAAEPEEGEKPAADAPATDVASETNKAGETNKATPALAPAADAASKPDANSEPEPGPEEDAGAPLSAMGTGLSTQGSMTVPGGDATLFSYTGAAQSYDVAGDGYYLLEVWGAQGGRGGTYGNQVGGNGGNTSGIIKLKTGEPVWVYVGGQGEGGNSPVKTNYGGFNGGGNGAGNGVAAGRPQGGGAGGGASDIRIGDDSLFNRVIVAGGGGGGVAYKAYGTGRRGSGYGAAGGGASGGNGYSNTTFGGTKTDANGGGTQTRGGIASTTNWTYKAEDGTFGEGGNGAAPTAAPGGGGGGGWYGGAGGGGGPAGDVGSRGAHGTKAGSGSGGSGFVWTGQDLTLPEGGVWGLDAEHALIETSMSSGARGGAGQARITRLKWTVSFDGNGGTGARDSVDCYVNDIEDDTFVVDYVVPASTVADCGFTRTGYTFAGWATTPSGGDVRDTQIKLNSNQTLYARWTPNVYAIDLVAPDATSTGFTEALYEKYDTGFYLTSDCAGDAVSDVDVPERVCNVTYQAGCEDPSAVLPRANDEATAAFRGYYSQAGGVGDQLIDASGALTAAMSTDRFDENASAYAAWEPAAVTLPAPTRPGYDFAGWYAASERVGGAGDEFVPEDTNVTLTAAWTPRVFAIALDNSDATTRGSEGVFLKYDNGIYSDEACTERASAVVPPQRAHTITYDTAEKGALPAERQNPETVSHLFSGYTPQGTDSTKLIGADGAVMPAFTNRYFLGDATLHAGWSLRWTELPNVTPAEPHLKFLGWAPEADAHAGMSAGSSYTPTDDVTLHALWAEVWYKISYAGLEGVEGFNPPDVVDLGTTTEPLEAQFVVPIPHRPGYEFTGWSITGMTSEEHWIGGESTTSTSATGVKATSFKRLQTENDATVSFTATWREITCEVALDNQGATTSGSTAVWQAYGQDVYKTKAESAYGDPMGVGESGANPIALPEKSYALTYDLRGAGDDAPASGTATSTFGGYFTLAGGAGQQLLSATGHRTEAFSNKFYGEDASSPTLFAQWSRATVTLAPYVSHAPRLRFVGWSEREDATTIDHLPGDVIELTANKRLYAVYDEPTYEVDYAANGGEGAPVTQTKEHNVDLTLSDAVPTHEDTASAGVTLTFDANGGESTGAPNKTIVGEVDSAWSFASWNTRLDGTGSTYDAAHLTYADNADATLFAQWTETRTRADVTLPTPSYEGYRCDGWFTEPVGGTKVGDAGQTVDQPATDVKLFAHWSALEYKVRFIDNNEVKGEESFTYDAVEQPLLTAGELGLAREGWEFEGWRAGDELAVDYTDGQSVRNLSTSTGTIDFVAVWDRDIYFISGDAVLEGQSATTAARSSRLGTQDGEAIQTVSQLSDRTNYQTITTPALADVAGWRSLGWLASEVAASSPDVGAGTEFAPQSTDTFYGLYNRDVTLAFDGAGADSGSVETQADVQRMNASGNLTPVTFVLPANGFVRAGWRFAGWDMGRPGDAVTVKPAAGESASLTAQAEWLGPFEYAVAFDANGGTGAMGVQVMPEHVTRALSANAFTREGYAFVGWNTAADGSGTAYADAAEVVDLAEPDETAVLFAQWEPVPVPEPGPDPAVDPAPRESPSGAAAGMTPATGDVASPRAALLGVVGVAGLALVLGMRQRRRRG